MRGELVWHVDRKRMIVSWSLLWRAITASYTSNARPLQGRNKDRAAPGDLRIRTSVSRQAEPAEAC
jgi:hypothetical protein